MSTAKIIIIIKALVTSKDPIVKIVEGIAGTMNARVAYTDMMEGIPKMIAVLKLISPFLYFGKTPTRLVDPTINKE
jgi:hypothetical protein